MFLFPILLKNFIFWAGSQPQTQIAMRLQVVHKRPVADQSKTNQRFNEKVRSDLTGNNGRARNEAPVAALAMCGHTAKKTSSWSDWRLPWRNGVRRSEGTSTQVATSSLTHQAITVAVAGQAPNQRCHGWSNSLYGRSCGVALWEQQALAEEKSQSPSPKPETFFFEITSPFLGGYSTQIRQHLQEIHRAIVCKAASPRKWPPVPCSQTSLSTKKHHTYKGTFLSLVGATQKTAAMFYDCQFFFARNTQTIFILSRNLTWAKKIWKQGTTNTH